MVNTFQTISTYVIKLLIACMFLFPVHAEETPSPSPSPTPETQNNDDLIDYLERQKAEQAEKEKQEQEKKAQEEQEKQENLYRASFDSSSDVIYGYANKFPYYFIGYIRSNNYSNYTYYGYYFTQYTQFEKIGNIVYFKNGKGKYVYCTNGGCNVSELRDSFTIPNWHNIQSNIYEVDFPAVTSIDKNYVHIIDFATQIISAILSIIVLYSLCNRLFINKGKRF